MKIAIFCEDRYKNNNQFNKKIEPNLEPYHKVREILGKENCITYDLLEKRNDRNDFIIISWLPINIFTILKYIKLLIKYRRNKKFLFLKEPPVVAKLQYKKIIHIFFNRIYTWDDNLINNTKYYKLIWQQSNVGLNIKKTPFKEKKFLTLINGNKFSPWKNELYSEREKAIRFFEKYLIKQFDLYGTNWDKPNLKQKIFGFKSFQSYKGKVDDKFKILSKYKFNICFENMNKIDGYVTEKIWDSFKAKSIPIYLGAENISSYIPTNCFIDMRNFNNYNELINFLEQITEKKYNDIIQNIELFLNTSKAKKNFTNNWAKDFIKRLN